MLVIYKLVVVPFAMLFWNKVFYGHEKIWLQITKLD